MTVLQQAKLLVDAAQANLRGAQAILETDDRYKSRVIVDRVAAAGNRAEDASDLIDGLIESIG